VNNVSTLTCFFWMFWIKIARKKHTQKHTRDTHARALLLLLFLLLHDKPQGEYKQHHYDYFHD